MSPIPFIDGSKPGLLKSGRQLVLSGGFAAFNKNDAAQYCFWLHPAILMTAKVILVNL
jgi:hypothetical protein